MTRFLELGDQGRHDLVERLTKGVVCGCRMAGIRVPRVILIVSDGPETVIGGTTDPNRISAELRELLEHIEADECNGR